MVVKSKQNPGRIISSQDLIKIERLSKLFHEYAQKAHSIKEKQISKHPIPLHKPCSRLVLGKSNGQTAMTKSYMNKKCGAYPAFLRDNYSPQSIRCETTAHDKVISKGCIAEYIGQTSRKMKMRISEYEKGKTRPEDKAASFRLRCNAAIALHGIGDHYMEDYNENTPTTFCQCCKDNGV